MGPYWRRVGAVAQPLLVSCGCGVRVTAETLDATAVLTMGMSAGGVIGPLLAGSIEEAIGSLRAGLVVCGFLSVALTIAGITLRVRSNHPSS